MALQQIRPKLLKEWKKKGDLLVIWRCERCYKKIPFYKQNPFIDNIRLAWTHNHKYCDKCEKKLKKNNRPKENNPENLRINLLLEKYEFYEELEEDYLHINYYRNI